MTKAEILKQLKELQEQVDMLTEDDVKIIRTLPIEDEKYTYIAAGDLCFYKCYYPGMFDNYQIKENSSIGNYFKSEEDAEMVVRAMQIEQAIRIRRIELNDGWEPDWDDEVETKYLISKVFDSITSGTTHLYDISPVFGYYKSHEIAQQIIDEFEDDLLWYFNEYYPKKDKMYIWE